MKTKFYIVNNQRTNTDFRSFLLITDKAIRILQNLLMLFIQFKKHSLYYMFRVLSSSRKYSFGMNSDPNVWPLTIQITRWEGPLGFLITCSLNGCLYLCHLSSLSIDPNRSSCISITTSDVRPLFILKDCTTN